VVVKRGDVIFWRAFPFEDNSSQKLAPSNKLLVVMGANANDTLVMFRVTSQERDDRPDVDGCHHEQSVYRFNKNRNKFEKPCWVQYEMPIYCEQRELVNAKANVIFSLKDEEIRAVINCYKKSPELTNWVWDYCK
jgi:hypothetical protein